MVFYAIARGRNPGIYTSWNDAQKQIKGFTSARFKKFDTHNEAKVFIDETPISYTNSSILNFVEREDPQENDNCLICFTDGACKFNGKKNAISSFAVVWPEHPEIDHCEVVKGDHHTNNIGEYMAAICAFNQANILDPNRVKTLIIYTDSMLLINSLSNWIHGWKKNDWRKSDGEIIKNLEIVKELDRLMQIRKVLFRHVKAHTGNNDWESRYNDKVDKLAQNCLIKN